jgi:hypothetical protein
MKILFLNAPKLGSVPDEILADARAAGLSETGIEAARSGDKEVYRRELRRLEHEHVGSIWACTTGYAMLFQSSTEAERTEDYKRADRQLNAISHQIPKNVDVIPARVAEQLHRQICDMP